MSRQFGKPVTINDLTKIDSTTFKFEHSWYKELLTINHLADIKSMKYKLE